jgi:hypothetical protein
MKKLNIVFAIVVIVLIRGTLSAQTVGEHHKNLAKHHEAILKSTTNISNGTSKDPKKNSEDIGTNLDSAKIQHAEIQSKQSATDKTASQQHHDIIAKNHANSVRYNEALKQELAKPNPDKAKIKQNTLSISNEVNEAKKHHEEIKKLTGKK